MIRTDTQKIVTQLRLSGWSEAVKERLDSGQTVSAFCEEKGISQTTYYYRLKKVREAACTELMRVQSSFKVSGGLTVTPIFSFNSHFR